MKKVSAALVFSAVLVHAQLIPAGRPVPRTTKPPVVFVNGYQISCPASYSGTFGVADQVLQRAGYVSLFFDNCTIPNRPLIEELGDHFGEFLRGLRYEDGQPVTEVNVVAHSMGGLIVRSYLSGKRPAVGEFNPPAQIPIRRIVFLGTPHFGTIVGLFAGNRQGDQLTAGNRFLYDLAAWNQGSDDLRGVEALALIGDAGAGVTNTARFDDAVTSLTSGSLDFVYPGRTRILPYCHITGSLIDLFRLCPANTPGLAAITSESHLSARGILSFFEGTQDWPLLGQSPAQNSFLSSNNGVLVVRTNGPQLSVIESATVSAASGSVQNLAIRDQAVAYREMTPSGLSRITIRSEGAELARDVTLAAGGMRVINFSDPPVMFPAASRIFPLALAPGMFVAIYGRNLAPRVETAASLPFPLRLADTEVLAGGIPMPLHYASPEQINAVLPESASGRTQIVIRRNGTPDLAFHVLIESAVPAIFTADRSGAGLAAAVNAVTGQVITEQNPLAEGDYVSLYLTGLGRTERRGGLDWAVEQPLVWVGGQSCGVTYAGRAPGYAGLDQINCRLVTFFKVNSMAETWVETGGRKSNVVILPVR